MIRNLSIAILNWGNTKQATECAEMASKWSNDVYVVQLNGLETGNSPFERSFLSWDYVWKHGYGQTWNKIILEARNEYAYILGKTKKIVRIDPLLQALIDTGEPVIGCVSDGEKEGHVWYKCGHKDKSKWVGKVHEELWPVRMNNKEIKRSEHAPIKWERMGLPDSNLSLLDYAAMIYRDITRLKWLVTIQREGKYRYGTSQGWWTMDKHKLTDKNVETFNRQKHCMEYGLDNFLQECENWKKDKTYEFTHTW